MAFRNAIARGESVVGAPLAAPTGDRCVKPTLPHVRGLEIPQQSRIPAQTRRGHLAIATFAALAILTVSSPCARAQAQPLPGPDVREIYNRLLPQIEAIRAFDNHGHPGYANDTDVDAMAIPADSSAPLRLRDENIEILDAVKFLFNYPYSDFSPDHQRWLVDKKAAAKAKLGAGYFSHILDQVGIETAIANRVSMPPYLDPARFRWVFFVDNFLFPFDTQQLESRNPDQKLNLPLERKLLARNLSKRILKISQAISAAISNSSPASSKPINPPAKSASNSKSRISARFISTIRKNRAPQRSTRSIARAASPRPPNTATFRITSFAICCERLRASICLCKFTLQSAAVIST